MSKWNINRAPERFGSDLRRPKYHIGITIDLIEDIKASISQSLIISSHQTKCVEYRTRYVCSACGEIWKLIEDTSLEPEPHGKARDTVLPELKKVLCGRRLCANPKVAKVPAIFDFFKCDRCALATGCCDEVELRLEIVLNSAT